MSEKSPPPRQSGDLEPTRDVESRPEHRPGDGNDAAARNAMLGRIAVSHAERAERAQRLGRKALERDVVRNRSDRSR